MCQSFVMTEVNITSVPTYRQNSHNDLLLFVDSMAFQVTLYMSTHQRKRKVLHLHGRIGDALRLVRITSMKADPPLIVRPVSTRVANELCRSWHSSMNKQHDRRLSVMQRLSVSWQFHPGVIGEENDPFFSFLCEQAKLSIKWRVPLRNSTQNLAKLAFGCSVRIAAEKHLPFSCFLTQVCS